MESCPKCGATRTEGATECPQCGIIYAKFAQKIQNAAQHSQSLNAESNRTLANCPACAKDVSTMALTCPHCGHPLRNPRAEITIQYLEKRQREKRQAKMAFLFVLGVIGFAYLLSLVIAK